MSCSLQHCPPAGPAAAFGGSLMGCLAQDAWGTALRVYHAALYLARRCKKWTMSVSDEKLPCPGNPSLVWFGHLHQELSVQGRESSSPACQCGTGQWGQGCPALPSITQLPQPLPASSGNPPVPPAQPGEFCLVKLCRQIKNAWGKRNLISVMG